MPTDPCDKNSPDGLSGTDADPYGTIYPVRVRAAKTYVNICEQSKREPAGTTVRPRTHSNTVAIRSRAPRASMNVNMYMAISDLLSQHALRVWA